jgi:hypothetical protein
MQRRWGALIEGPARARSRGSRRRKPTTMLPFWSRGCHARNPASGGYRARLRGALRPRGCSLCGCRSARKHQPSSHPHFGHGVGAAAGGATSGGGGEPHVRHEATRVHHAARRCGGRVAACGACAADRPGASSEMLRVECARACDDKFATRDGPVWLYSASRLRARLACRGGNHARDRSYFNHPRGPRPTGPERRIREQIGLTPSGSGHSRERQATLRSFMTRQSAARHSRGPAS